MTKIVVKCSPSVWMGDLSAHPREVQLAIFKESAKGRAFFEDLLRQRVGARYPGARIILEWSNSTSVPTLRVDGVRAAQAAELAWLREVAAVQDAARSHILELLAR